MGYTGISPASKPAVASDVCGWWVGPVWKDTGETCVCFLPSDHSMPHECTCGAWFEGCGHPPHARALTGGEEGDSGGE